MLCVQKTAKFSVLSCGQATRATQASGDADDTLFRKLIALFEARGVAHARLLHAPTLTSEASVVERRKGGWTDTTLGSGAKAMLMRRSKGGFALCVLAADRKLDWKKLKKAVAKDLRLATTEEVFEASRCVPGAVPPFGSQFFAETRTFVDHSLGQNERINFNCGLRTQSVRLDFDSYLALEQPTLVDIVAS
ncbi:hypothetical protein CTAYLR_004547 [Chrysophaeum taylorii]|uniref:YbaK/aminoacyl-tRNA synthetase-associated domain-containing protein n=1 Tax=Chrysophaeum taylorii TaxID=2483200 RepID=A0AAD7UQ64_9STRA|nr:hypothetical protein CTAYLR_004547 [Chrysophaeum taylorii]